MQVTERLSGITHQPLQQSKGVGCLQSASKGRADCGISTIAKRILQNTGGRPKLQGLQQPSISRDRSLSILEASDVSRKQYEELKSEVESSLMRLFSWSICIEYNTDQSFDEFYLLYKKTGEQLTIAMQFAQKAFISIEIVRMLKQRLFAAKNKVFYFVVQDLQRILAQPIEVGKGTIYPLIGACQRILYYHDFLQKLSGPVDERIAKKERAYKTAFCTSLIEYFEERLEFSKAEVGLSLIEKHELYIQYKRAVPILKKLAESSTKKKKARLVAKLETKMTSLHAKVRAEILRSIQSMAEQIEATGSRNLENLQKRFDRLEGLTTRLNFERSKTPDEEIEALRILVKEKIGGPLRLIITERSKQFHDIPTESQPTVQTQDLYTDLENTYQRIFQFIGFDDIIAEDTFYDLLNEVSDKAYISDESSEEGS